MALAALLPAFTSWSGNCSLRALPSLRPEAPMNGQNDELKEIADQTTDAQIARDQQAAAGDKPDTFEQFQEAADDAAEAERQDYEGSDEDDKD